MHTRKGLAPIVWLIIVALVLGGGYFAYRKYQPLTTNNQQQEKKEETSTKDWNTYRNEEYGFVASYPPQWEAQSTPVGVMFRPVGMVSDWQWVIEVSEESEMERIADIYTSEADRVGESHITSIPITLGHVGAATLVVVTNDEVQKMSPTWERRVVLLAREGRTYLISNGAVKADDYERFYQSFRFTK